MILKEIRLKNNFLQKEISQELGIKQNTYSQYEKGLRIPQIENIPKLAQILNCTIEEVVLALIETQNQNKKEA